MKTSKVLILIAVFALVFSISCKKEANEYSEAQADSPKASKGVVSENHDSEMPADDAAPMEGDYSKFDGDDNGPGMFESKDYDAKTKQNIEINRAANAPAASNNKKKEAEATTDKIVRSPYEERLDDETSEEPRPDDRYPRNVVNGFVKTTDNALSTFAIDVDTASYTKMRGEINAGRLPKPSYVRVEECINYFDYKYPAPSSGLFAVYSQIAENPFNYGETSLLRVALRAKDISKEARKTAHLTFMIDVSGSMMASNKLPLVKETLRILLDNLRDDDTIAICTYSTTAKKILEATRVKNKETILAAIKPLIADGSTNGQAGMHNAYELANNAFVKGDINRIIMCTDGDFNVGVTHGKSLAAEVNEYARKGITITAIGYGDINYDGVTCEEIADAGNGNFFYIDSVDEIKRVFGTNLVSTLDVVAADVKIQLEFNPNIVSEYRLVGYENRALTADQFRDDIVDAGEVGPGHAVTAIYELKMSPNVSEGVKIPEDLSGYAAMFRLRYKENITDEKASEVNFGVENKVLKFDKAEPSMKFAVGVMGFADRMRVSPYAKSWRVNTAIDCCNAGKTGSGAQADAFIEIMRKAISLLDR